MTVNIFTLLAEIEYIIHKQVVISGLGNKVGGEGRIG